MPGTGARSGRPAKPTGAGKRGKPRLGQDDAGGPRTVPPSIGGTTPGPSPRKQRGRPDAAPGRVRRAGGTPPVLNTPRVVDHADATAKRLGVPPAIANPSPRPPVAAAGRVLGPPPAADRPVPPVQRSQSRLRHLQRSTEGAEYLERLRKVAGLKPPVIEAPAGESRIDVGPVLGVRRPTP